MRRTVLWQCICLLLVLLSVSVGLTGCSSDSAVPTDSGGPLRIFTWSEKSLSSGAQFQGLQAAADNERVAVVANTLTDGKVLISTNGGLGWSEGPSLQLPELRGIAFLAGRFHVLGSQRLLRSENLLTWDTVTWPGGVNCACLLTSMDYSGTYYLAVGPTFAGFSSNGQLWSPYDKTLITPDYANLHKVVFHRNRMLMMVINRDSSNTQFYQSSNLVSWTLLSSIPSTTLNDFAPLEGGAVAVGEQGQVWYTDDLVIWHEGVSGTQQDLITVESSNNQYMAGGTGGVIIGSKRGDHWTDMPTGTVRTILDIIWTGTRYLGVGENVLLASE